MKIENSKKVLKEFGLIVGLGIPIIFGLILPIFTKHEIRFWTLAVGIPLIFISFVKPNLLFYPYKLWMKLGEILGWINSRLILGLVYLIVLQPIALIMKLFGYDPLKKKKNHIINSYRENNKNSVINLKKIF